MKRLLQFGLIFFANCLLTINSGKAQNTITAYQYWFDNDYSINTVSHVPPAEQLQLETAIPLASISKGLHVFTIRFRDENGLWSSPVNQYFYNRDLANNRVTGYQYWFDDDFASNQLVPVSPEEHLQLNTLLSFETVSEGLHVFNIRFRDSKGYWSIPASQFFYKSGNVFEEENKIIGYRYWLNNDIAGRKYVPVDNPVQLLNLSGYVDISAIKSGDYTIYFQFKDKRQVWSTPVSGTFSFDSTRLQKIVVSLGWNIISFNEVPVNPGIKTIFQPLINSVSLVKIQNQEGNSLEDWGIYGGWTDNIGIMRLSEGYKVKMKKNTDVRIYGDPVHYPFAIPLKKGWNIAGFPQKTAFNGMDHVVKPLLEKGILVKVQDERGNSIEDWGTYGGWTNTIGDFLPGEGYSVKVNANDTLWIYEHYPKSGTVLPKPLTTVHFKPEFEGNGIDHMNIILVGLPVSDLNVGDELAVFDGPVCTGAVRLQEHHLQKRAVSVAASAADLPMINGFTEGNRITVKLWDQDENQEYVLEPEIKKGTELFARLETSVFSLEKSTATGVEETSGVSQTGIKCYPNPFSNGLTVEINLENSLKVQVEVLNQLGQQVKVIYPQSELNSGKHQIQWNRENSANQRVSSGIYLVRAIVGDNVIFEKVICQ